LRNSFVLLLERDRRVPKSRMRRVSTLLQRVDLGVLFKLGTQDSALVVGARSRPLEEINLRLWYIRVGLVSITVDSSVGTLSSRICLLVILIICRREEL